MADDRVEQLEAEVARLSKALETMRRGFLSSRVNYLVSGSLVRALEGPYVYVWERGNQTLYVGVKQTFGAEHHVRWAPDGFRDTDRIRILPSPNAAEARWLERALIWMVTPERNIVRPTEDPFANLGAGRTLGADGAEYDGSLHFQDMGAGGADG